LTENPVKLQSEYCSKCLICYSICPFEAISLNKETGDLILDIEKCQVCGLCFSACPSSSIEIAYYETSMLSSCVEKMRKDNLMLICKGSMINPQVRESLKKHGILDDNSLQLYVPCIGRIPPEFLLKALKNGVKKIVIVPCESDKCRFNVGSNVGVFRLILLQRLLRQIGLDSDALFFYRYFIRAQINRHKCIGCGNCAYTCPGNAIKIVSPGIAQIDEESCLGCGACVSVCPALAINLEGFENDLILGAISRYRPLIEEIKVERKKPVIAVFYCQWANFPAPDKYFTYTEDNVIFFEVPCSSMINPLYVLKAFYEGFDGILIAACKKSECKFEKGNEIAEKHIKALKDILKQINLGGKLEICFVAPRYLGELDNQIKLFIEKLNNK